MVQGGVEKDASVIPGCALDPDRFVQAAHLLKGLGHDRDVVLAEQSSVKAVVGPDNILDTANSQLRQLLLLLDVEEDNVGGRDEEQASSTAKVDVSGAGRGLDRFRGRVAQILDVHLLVALAEDGESVAGNKDSRRALTTLDIRRLNSTSGIARKVNQFVHATVGRRGNQDGTFSGVVREGARRHPRGSELAQRQHRRGLDVLGEVIRLDVLFLCDVEELVLVDSRGRTLTLELEHHDTGVVTSSEQIDLWMSSNNPEAVQIALE